MRSIISYILIVFGLLALAASTSRSFMAWVSDKRNENEAWWGVSKPVNGDLVNMALLEKVKQFHSPRDYAFELAKPDSGAVNLYAWGDSYIWKIPDSAYAGVAGYKYGWRSRDELLYTPDTTHKNILLIEVAERYVRSYFSTTQIFDHVKPAPPSVVKLLQQPAIYTATVLPAIEDWFNPYINQNLEYNLFNYNFISPIFHWKAALNYYAFDRASGDVVISKNGKQLFLKETVTGNRPENSYYPVSDEELNTLVNNLNTIYQHYRQDFDEVYLSVIPNPATILQPKGYNNLIPKIYHHPKLKIKTIDIYDTFRTTKTTIYRPGDTHWNNNGLQLWLHQVNSTIMELSNSQN